MRGRRRTTPATGAAEIRRRGDRLRSRWWAGMAVALVIGVAAIIALARLIAGR